MKLRKKIAALLSAALVMTLFPTTVFATDVTSLSDNSVSGNVSGNINYVDTTKFLVTLPTTSNLDFALDPQGLSTLSDNETVSENGLASDMGKIVSKKTTYAKNQSSVPIKLSAKFYLTNNAGAAPTGLSIVSQNTAVSDNSLSLYLEVLSGAEKGLSSNSTAYVSTNYITAGTGKAITGTTSAAASELVYQLDKATYAFTNEGSLATPDYKYIIDTTVSDNYDCAYFTLSGNCAKNADWKDYTGATPTKTLKVNAVFTFSQLDTFVSAANSGTAYRVVTDTAQLDETATAITNPNLTITRTAGATSNSTTTLAATLTTLKYTKAGSTVKDVLLTAGTNYSVSGTTLNVLGSWISTFPAGTYELTATLSNASTQKIIITIN